MPRWPRAWGDPVGQALIRCRLEDFQVTEQLGFELSGEGEHCFLYLEKRGLNTLDLVKRLSALSGIPARRIGFSGLKDRNAVTRQWISVGLAGDREIDWNALQAEGDIGVLAVQRHRRKLRRGVHKQNRFTLVLRGLTGDRTALEARLNTLRDQGVPNYFGEQRFGRAGSTLGQALDWMDKGKRLSREKRGLYLSALRAWVFNHLLAERVERGDWNTIRDGDICMLQGSRSFFACDDVSEDIRRRTADGDLHPGLPLWGEGATPGTGSTWAEAEPVSRFLESAGVKLAWRPARVIPDDFCWQFCDDDALQLDFALGAGSYATALLGEFVHYNENKGQAQSGRSSEQT